MDIYEVFKFLTENDIMTEETAHETQMRTIEKRIQKIYEEFNLTPNISFLESNQMYRIRIPSKIKAKYSLKDTYFGKDKDILLDKVYKDLVQYDFSNKSLADVYELWKEFRVSKINQKGKSITTAQKNFRAFEKEILPKEISNQKFNTITHADLTNLFDDLEGEKITLSRAKEIKTVLNLLWDFGLEKGICDVNVARNYIISEHDFIPTKFRVPKTDTERLILIDYFLSLNTVYGYALSLLECLNIRIGELKALKWTDISFENAEMYITHSVNDLNEYTDYTKNKMAEGFRIIPLSDRAISILLKLKEQNYNFRDDFLFLGKTDNFILTGECNKNYTKACKELGINKRFTTHDCRRFAATQCSLAGMSTPAMQKAFGWKDRDTAEKYVQTAAASKEHLQILKEVLN